MSRVLLLAGLLCGAVAVRAQTALVVPLTSEALPDLPPHSLLKISVVHLRNITPAMAVHWLDPKNTPSSIFEQNSRRNWLFSGESLETLPSFDPPVPVALPTGLSVIKPLEGKNSVLLLGSQQAVDEAGSILKRLDLPLEQVEMDCLVVALSPQDFDGLGLNLQPAGVTTSGDKLWMGKSGSFLKTQMAAWAKDGRALTLAGGRFVAIEGMASSMGNSLSRLATISGKDGREDEPAFDATLPNAIEKPRLVDAAWMTFKPKANPDLSLSADFRISRVLALEFERTTPKADRASANPAATPHILQVIDSFTCPLSGSINDTFVITGFSPTKVYGRDLAAMPMLKGKTAAAFVTLKRVVRDHDNEP